LTERIVNPHQDPGPPGNIHIATCAWSFEDWRDVFYPPHLPPAKRLEFYAHHLPAVEVDSTFYHAPSQQTAAHWHDITPRHFRFACKLPREITHERKLRESAGELAAFLRDIEPLAEKLFCVLVQLPPFFTPKRDEHALRDFVRSLPAATRFAIEFRNHDWHLPRIAHLLQEHRVCWAWSDTTPIDHALEGAFDFLPDTTDFLYVRLMGDLEKKYDGPGSQAHRYREITWERTAALDNWAARIRREAAEKASAFIAVNNHYEGFAPQTCGRLAERLGMSIELPVAAQPGGKKKEHDQQLDLL
jgi:uncharacterized protein YecE (DUF72 family)